MTKIRLEFDGFKCGRCGHEWIARRKEDPRVCPKCKSPYWNVPKRQNSSVVENAKKVRAAGKVNY